MNPAKCSPAFPAGLSDLCNPKRTGVRYGRRCDVWMKSACVCPVRLRRNRTYGSARSPTTKNRARERKRARARRAGAEREAAARGFDTISTTLTISPYQLTDAILEELEAATERHGLKVDARDFRDRYREATRRSREKGMYRQNYCGCRFSIAEAEEQRRAAKRKRDEEKRLRHVALLCMAAEGIRTQK